MRNFFITACLLSGSLLTVSCSSDNSEQQAQEAVATTGEPVIGGDSVLNEDQRELFMDIARHNLFQVELGRMASERGVSEDVKQFGQQKVEWYTSKQQELKEMAQTYQVTLDQEVYQDYRDDVDEIGNAKQEDFDEEYWKNVIEAQRDLLGEYDNVLKDLAETDASAFTMWARSSMKELQAQMEQAMTFEKRLQDRPQ